MDCEVERFFFPRVSHARHKRCSHHAARCDTGHEPGHTVERVPCPREPTNRPADKLQGPCRSSTLATSVGCLEALLSSAASAHGTAPTLSLAGDSISCRHVPERRTEE